MKLFIILFSLVGSTLLAQQFPYKKLREVKLQSNVDRISVDRLGGFYTVNKCGIEKFDSEGKKEKNYLTKVCTDTELLEAWQLARIYAYQKSKQRFIVFNPNMEIIEFLVIDPSFAVEPQLATPSPDLQSYWILDVDNSIKKIDLHSKTVSLESDTLKNIKGKFIHLREYQSLLFLLNTDSGIYVMNKLGKLVSQIQVSGISYFSFAGEDLYYLKENKITLYDIFSEDTYSIDVPPGNKFVVATDERLILIRDGLAEIFEFTPKK